MEANSDLRNSLMDTYQHVRHFEMLKRLPHRHTASGTNGDEISITIGCIIVLLQMHGVSERIQSTDTATLPNDYGKLAGF